jgi:hypothetical protein
MKKAQMFIRKFRSDYGCIDRAVVIIGEAKVIKAALYSIDWVLILAAFLSLTGVEAMGGENERIMGQLLRGLIDFRNHSDSSSDRAVADKAIGELVKPNGKVPLKQQKGFPKTSLACVSLSAPTFVPAANYCGKGGDQTGICMISAVCGFVANPQEPMGDAGYPATILCQGKKDGGQDRCPQVSECMKSTLIKTTIAGVSNDPNFDKAGASGPGSGSSTMASPAN